MRLEMMVIRTMNPVNLTTILVPKIDEIISYIDSMSSFSHLMDDLDSENEFLPSSGKFCGNLVSTEVSTVYTHLSPTVVNKKNNVAFSPSLSLSLSLFLSDYWSPVFETMDSLAQVADNNHNDGLFLENVAGSLQRIRDEVTDPYELKREILKALKQAVQKCVLIASRGCVKGQIKAQNIQEHQEIPGDQQMTQEQQKITQK